MRRYEQLSVLTALILLPLSPPAAIACLWDYDTIKMERSRFPNTLEIISGKFLRHSREFYQWRIEDRLKRLESDPKNVSMLDDLAVAYDKIGEHDKAIETALKTEEMHSGRYETAANIGTFYFHAGTPQLGVPYIERALQINPNAHFGREKYQKLLTDYVLRQRANDPTKLPLANVVVSPGMAEQSPSAQRVTFEQTFEDSLRVNPSERLTPEEYQAAIGAVLGMMRFADHESPILLETLGSLLAQSTPTRTDAKLLAARAYLKASYEAGSEPARVAYRGMAAAVLRMQMIRTDFGEISLEQVEADFQQELIDARAWYAELHKRELLWIRDGKNPEIEFDRLYAADPQLPGVDVADPMSLSDKVAISLIAAGLVCVLTTVAACVILAVRLRRFLNRASSGSSREA